MNETVNNNKSYTFYPPIKKEIVINSFKINIIHLELFKCVRIMVMLYDINEKLIDNRMFMLDGDEYKAWSDDDNYIIRYVKEKLTNN